MKYRITIRGDGCELRGYMKAPTAEAIQNAARIAEPFGVMIASPASEDYDPFRSPSADALPGDVAWSNYIALHPNMPAAIARQAFAAGWDARRRYDERPHDLDYAPCAGCGHPTSFFVETILPGNKAWHGPCWDRAYAAEHPGGSQRTPEDPGGSQRNQEERDALAADPPPF